MLSMLLRFSSRRARLYEIDVLIGNYHVGAEQIVAAETKSP